ncbi:ABC transporter ATP-binding protein [Ferrovibrio sp.]|uniref:ABC transporter ATP-binding protein n=1 Tax=Ferrovibrio sp. TaxID=1917215 RepID=UPI0026265A05|nr:ABC transporter ATP-binding protein [Ferrovibrio sp.]
MSFLELRGLGKRYGDIEAVSSCDLTVEKGEFVCLLGPSGCGKTTTLQMIAGFVPPTSGQVFLDGRDITALKPSRRGLGIVFQSYALFPHMTVAENVAFGLEMRRIGRGEREQRVTETLALVHLDAMTDRYPGELSGGQRQRVALARALVIQPQVLLLDEPMGALDAKLREDMQIELRALQRRVAITTIMVTHDQAEAMTLSDRIVLMNRGQVEQVARPYDMYERPNGQFASTFLGKANVFSGRSNGKSVLAGDRWFPVEGNIPEGDVDYIIRPEKIEIVDTAPLLHGKVSARVFLGNHWLFQVDTPLGPMHLTQPNTGMPATGEGDVIGMSWVGAHARVVASGTSR